MCIDGGISCRSGKIFILTVGNVLVGSWITVFLGETKVDNVNDALTFAQADEEVVRFDVSMDEAFGVDVFEPTEELVG